MSRDGIDMPVVADPAFVARRATGVRDRRKASMQLARAAGARRGPPGGAIMVASEALDPHDGAAPAGHAPFAFFGERGMHRSAGAAPPPLAAGLFGMGSVWPPEPLLALRRAAGCEAAYGAAA